MVYVQFHGRLGNWMFQYAAALSLSDKPQAYTYDPRVVKILPKCSPVFDTVKLCNIPSGDVNVVSESNFSQAESLAACGDIRLIGYFQGDSYFDHSLIRDRFAMSAERSKRIHEKFGDVLKISNVTGIHVRRGDYLKLYHTHPFVGKKYLRDTIRRLPECTDFIVCSDDIPWCKKFFVKNFPDRHFHFSDLFGPLDDLYLLSCCKNNIMSNSTFSWWAAWLNGNQEKRVFAPSMWFGFAHNNGVRDWDSLYFNGITVIENQYTRLTYVYAKLQYWHRLLKHRVYCMLHPNAT